MAALAAARRWSDIELVSMDSMQVYREMDIGTAKASEAERRLVSHHMLDIADPGEEYSVARFQAEARAVITAIEARGHRALLVGGTGLYVQAVIDDLRFPGEDRELRARIEARFAGDDGLRAAYATLQELDPVAAARMEPGNRRRVVRALEVIELTGERFSSFGAGIGAEHPTVVTVRMAGLLVDAETSSVRLADRLGRMLAAGLLDEVRGLMCRPAGWSRTARQAIGYKELIELLDGRVASMAQAAERVMMRSRHFARRQHAWFRRDERITWFDVSEKSTPAADAVMAWWDS